MGNFRRLPSLDLDLSENSLSGPDPQQFIRLFVENERRIYGFILSILPNRTDAEDMLQETSLILWRKFAQFQPGTDFVAWACRVAQLEVLKFHEKRGGSRLRFEPGVLEAVADETLNMAPLLDDRHRALNQCLESLSSRDRDLLQRRYGNGAKPQQIASQVGRSIHAIYKALSRIHDALMRCIQWRLEEEKKEWS